jgi:hypothetical protein
LLQLLLLLLKEEGVEAGGSLVVVAAAATEVMRGSLKDDADERMETSSDPLCQTRVKD